VSEPRLIEGDCFEHLRGIPADSIDACVTDGPYGISFMQKEWDQFDADKIADRVEYDRQVSRGEPYASAAQKAGIYDNSSDGNRRFQEWTRAWAVEVYRVLKPGAHLLSFGGTRTYHRMTCGLEDAGFEIRDSIAAWIFGSGFPKSLDVSKAIDKAAGAKGTYGEPKSEAHAGWIARGAMRGEAGHEGYQRPWMEDAGAVDRNARQYNPSSPDAAKWQGWGTALKPAHEPIVMARKPFDTTVAANVLKHGTGALNIDACRVGQLRPLMSQHDNNAGLFEMGGRSRVGQQAGGRWPANLILSHAPGCVLRGRKVVPADTHVPANSGDTVGKVVLDGGWAARDQEEVTVRQEEVDDFLCVENCPVAELDRQSGAGASPLSTRRKTTGTDFGQINDDGWKPSGTDIYGYGDAGGASRFFATFKGVEWFRPITEGLMAEWSQKHANIAESLSPLPNELAVSALSDAVILASRGARRLTNLSLEPSTSVTGSVLKQCAESVIVTILSSGEKFSLGLKDIEDDANDHVRNAEIRRPIGTTTTTLGLLMSDGSVVNVTFDCTRDDSEHGEAAFRYVPKASRSERENGLGPPLPCLRCARADEQGKPRHPDGDHVYNSHPTVKPLNLMRYLVRLVTPPGGTVLDPFAGSGTTLIAAKLEGFNAIGIERGPEYVEIARARLAAKWIVEEDWARPKAPRATPPDATPSLARWL